MGRKSYGPVWNYFKHVPDDLVVTSTPGLIISALGTVRRAAVPPAPSLLLSKQRSRRTAEPAGDMRESRCYPRRTRHTRRGSRRRGPALGSTRLRAPAGPQVVLITLFLFELSAYLTVTSTTDLVVDELVDETLRVNFNVTLHQVPCEFLSVDVSDMTGAATHDIRKDSPKWRLDSML